MARLELLKKDGKVSIYRHLPLFWPFQRDFRVFEILFVGCDKCLKTQKSRRSNSGRFHLSGGKKPWWVGIQSPGAPTKNRSVGSSPKSSEKGLDTTWLKDPNSQMAKNRVALWHRYSPGVVNYTDNKNCCSSSHLCQLNPHCLYMYAGDSRLIPILTSKLPLMACLKSSQTTRWCLR